MDKLKYVKLENQDGTYSDSIPLSVDSDYIDINGTTLTNTLNKKPYYYSTVANMKADTKLKAGDMVITLGYHSENDGGASKYVIKASSDKYYETLSNNLKAELIIEDRINVKQVGAYGDGVHDDTAAMEAAWDLQWALTLAPSSADSATTNTYPKIFPVYFPRGNYLYNGDGRTLEENELVYIYGESPSSTTIYIQKTTTVLFNTTNRVRWIEVRNLCFIGGSGIFNQRWSGVPAGPKNVVDRGPLIEGCIFKRYRGCCIGSNCNDWPYWYINNNTFAGTVNSIGVATPGDTAQTMISNNSFTLNRYHIKCIDGGRGVVIMNNDFIKGESRTNRDPNVSLHDIWIQPSYSQWGIGSNFSSGNKCVITKNKFGGENVLANDYKIIIANAVSADADYLSSLEYSTTEYTRGQLVHTVIEKDNMFNWVPSYPGEAVIYVAINHLYNNDWNIHANHVKYFVKFADPFYTEYENRTFSTDDSHVDSYWTLTSQWGFGTNLLEVSSKGSFFVDNRINISNIKEYFLISDPMKIALDYNEINTINKDHYYKMLSSDHLSRPNLSSQATSEYSEDIHGTTFGNKITLPSSGQWFAFNAGDFRINFNKPVYVEFDIKSTNENSENESLSITCSSRVYDEGGNPHEKYIYKKGLLLTNDYVHYQIKLNLYAPFLNTVFTNATNSSVQVDIQNFVVYASDSPQSLIEKGHFGDIVLYNNDSHNAKIKLESNNTISITFADGTVKYISLTDNAS